MTNYLKPPRLTAIILAFTFGFFSCQKEEMPGGGLTLVFKAGISETTKSSLTEGLYLETFSINIGEIELEFDDDDPMFANDSIASDYELEGPFEVDLLNDGNPLPAIIADNVDLPVAAYDEIEFEFQENENPASEMFGKSFLISGTINQIPFVFWTDEEIEVEIEFEQDFTLEEAQQALLTVSLDVLSLFNNINILEAIDGNQDGTIEIHPDDPDGNEQLAELIAEYLEEIIEAFEESNDDDEDDDDDDD